MYEIIRMVVSMILLVLLGMMAVQDWKKAEVPVIYLKYGIFVVSIEMIYLIFAKQMLQFRLGISGFFLGVVCMLVSYRTKEKIGYADSIAIGIVGIHLGIFRMFGVLLVSFFCLFVAVAFKEGLKKTVLKKSLPFLPFLFLGYLGAGIL